jgi:peptidoglycan/xylan/chitin deacetylase (PgdA/CDA1 family)
MEIGAHSRTHPDLTLLTGAALADEVAGARRELEDLLGRPVRSFAYPYGAHTTATVEAVVAAGYSHACTTRAGRIDPRDGPWRIRRITLTAGDDADELVRKLWLGANQARRRDLALNLCQRVLAGAPARAAAGLLARER